MVNRTSKTVRVPGIIGGGGDDRRRILLAEDMARGVSALLPAHLARICLCARRAAPILVNIDKHQTAPAAVKHRLFPAEISRAL